MAPKAAPHRSLLIARCSMARAFVARFLVVASVIVASLIAQLLLAALPQAAAQSTRIKPGDAIISRFGGTRPVKTATGKIRHVIDPNGVVAALIDLNRPGQPPKGQHWKNVPQSGLATARQVGQVFGIALDDASPPNIYLSATSAFGLYRTLDNRGWMKGMWGKTGGPGTVYKLNAKNDYRPEVLTHISLNGHDNGGTGLGNIAFDAAHHQFFVSDLETGMIHRISAKNGKLLSVFDHGTTGRRAFFDAASGKKLHLPPVPHVPKNHKACADPATPIAHTPACWPYAAPLRRVWGLGVLQAGNTISKHKKAGTRLYYALWAGNAKPASDAVPGTAGTKTDDGRYNRIWSVTIGPNGDFVKGSVRREFALPLLSGQKHVVSAPVDIAFSKFGEMLIGERGEPANYPITPARPVNRLHAARVLQYQRDKIGNWQLAGKYDVGNVESGHPNTPLAFNNAAGGVAWGYGYEKSGELDPANPHGFVWTAGDGLCAASAPCYDAKTDTTTDKAHITGIEGRPVNYFLANIDGTYKISTIWSRASLLGQAQTLISHDSREIGDIEIFTKPVIGPQTVRETRPGRPVSDNQKTTPPKQKTSTAGAILPRIKPKKPARHKPRVSQTRKQAAQIIYTRKKYIVHRRKATTRKTHHPRQLGTVTIYAGGRKYVHRLKNRQSSKRARQPRIFAPTF